MTFPLWAPFALLTAVCALCPLPGWMSRVDWLRVVVLVVFPFACWAAFVWWLA